MKSNWFLLIGIVVLSTILMGCGSDSANQASNTASTSTPASANSNTPNQVGQEQVTPLGKKRPRPEMPETRPTNLKPTAPVRDFSYDELRADLTKNYDQYVAIMNARPNANSFSNDAIQADFRAIIDTPKEEDFIANSPHISKAQKDIFFNGVLLIIDTIRREM